MTAFWVGSLSARGFWGSTQGFGVAWQVLSHTVPPCQLLDILVYICFLNHYTGMPDWFIQPTTLEVQGHRALIKVTLETAS